MNLKTKLLNYGLSATHSGDLANGRRTPSMDLAARLYRDLGIDPKVWVDDQERKLANEADSK
jgi:plasmid maintenance system antidote protein VapI